jgi:hypothetical protein
VCGQASRATQGLLFKPKPLTVKRVLGVCLGGTLLLCRSNASRTQAYREIAKMSGSDVVSRRVGKINSLMVAAKVGFNLCVCIIVAVPE